MRITRATLLKIAEDTVARLARSERTLVAAYLQGSLAGEEEPVLGGTADIDLVLIHDLEPASPREIVRLTDDVHLDITHHTRAVYRQPRALRVHPWLGPAIYHCKILHDPHHFLDFAQASVRDQFYRPMNMLARAQGQLDAARKTWFAFQLGAEEPGLEEAAAFLDAIANTANAIACLSGQPLTERRFMLAFPARAGALEAPEVSAGVVGLLGGSELRASSVQGWLPEWQQTYEAVGVLPDCPPKLHPARLFYYRHAIEILLEEAPVFAALWPFLSTWLDAGRALPLAHPALPPLRAALESLGLIGGGFAGRVKALDAVLDLVEDGFESWARARGV